MSAFAVMPPSERRTIIEEAAAVSGLATVIIEKDYWVCWTLRRLFQQQAVAEHLVFKGGTSLSKVFGVIQRFSEDIDLSVAPACLGFADTAWDSVSKSKRAKLMVQLQDRCAANVEHEWQPLIEVAIRAELGPPAATSWTHYRLDERTASPVLTFAYPAVSAAPSSYIVPQIKLEFGSLTDQQPTGTHTVEPLLKSLLPMLTWDTVTLVALEVERTFWEKATILHAEYHRPKDKPIPVNFARHFSDLAALW